MVTPVRRIIVKSEPFVEFARSFAPCGEKIGPEGVAMDIEFEIDLVKGCGEDAMFSEYAAHVTQDSPASDLGDFEMNYLHNLCHPNDLLSHPSECILPDNVITSVPTTVKSSDLIEQTKFSDIPSIDSALNPTSLMMKRAASTEDAVQPPPEIKLQALKGAEMSGISTISRDVPQVCAASSVKISKPVVKKQKRSNVPQLVHQVSKNRKENFESDESAAERSSPCSSQYAAADLGGIRAEDLDLFYRDPVSLTPEEMKIVKKQRRLFKNRESAQLSRHRKKLQMNALERQVEALKKEKSALVNRVQELQDENERIRHQILSSL